MKTRLLAGMGGVLLLAGTALIATPNARSAADLVVSPSLTSAVTRGVNVPRVGHWGFAKNATGTTTPKKKHATGTVYAIDFHGMTLDLDGFVETNAIGDFEPVAFGNEVLDYSITISNNGVAPFTFTPANSEWGGSADLGADRGDEITIALNGSTIAVSAPLFPGPGAGAEFFLLAATTGSPSIRYDSEGLWYANVALTPDDVVFDFEADTASPFTLGTVVVVPEKKADCRHGAWKDETRENGNSFKNKAACISYVETEKEDVTRSSLPPRMGSS